MLLSYNTEITTYEIEPVLDIQEKIALTHSGRHYIYVKQLGMLSHWLKHGQTQVMP